MTPEERRKRIDELFLQAIEHAPSDQTAFLDNACAGDPALRGVVEELLRADAEAEGSGFLNPGAFDAAKMLAWMAGQQPSIAEQQVGLEIRVYEDQRLVYADVFREPVELGRQKAGEPGPFAKQREGDGWRLVIAGLDEHSVSRRHARLELLAGGEVQVTNLATRGSIGFQDGSKLTPGSTTVVPAPALLTIGTRVVRVQGS